MSVYLAIICSFLTASCSYVNAAPGSGRITGGEDANVAQFPYQASLQYTDGKHICGASIISDRFLLTAAECVALGAGIDPYPPQYYQVRVGSIQRGAGGQLLKLKSVRVHPSYVRITRSYNVALLELQAPLQFTDKIQMIELATEEVPPGADVVISGWGRTM